ncbi:MAG: terpene cyclase/mutase family protein [Planctomycetes bacterium]|nr:terpene cyclase/mutase family protein [Planctomycetota bacterium]
MAVVGRKTDRDAVSAKQASLENRAERAATAPADHEGTEQEDAGSEDAGSEDAGSEDYEEIAPTGRDFMLFMAAPSWMISLIVHMICIFLLAMITLPQPERGRTVLTVANPSKEPEAIEKFELNQIVEVPDMTIEPSRVGPTDALTTTTLDVEVPDVSLSTDLDAAPIQIDLTAIAERTAPKNVLTKAIGTTTGTGLAGRGAAMRSEMVQKYGGNAGSEAAVAMALKWIAAHQLPDGGWCFDHTIGPGSRLSPNPGGLREARNGATAMALLPFLGAGQTHLEGEYKEVVAKGLLFLIAQQKASGSLHESGGAMYSHGLASIVLTEAYAMSQDRKLAGPAQAACNFIVYAQDPVGGGWRYGPRTSGDTSVVGWQLMALKSGNMGYLQVPGNVIIGAGRFLDAVQTDGGAKYGYATPGAGPATTAVGLLCRMYMGWKHDHTALTRGIDYLDKSGPSDSNMYYNYYATQVMRHYGGEPWDRWNAKMRDFLVKTQSSDGPARGSWYIGGDHGAERGGRLYCTSMATMVLEVYYRHLPIYGKNVEDDEFPL